MPALVRIAREGDQPWNEQAFAQALKHRNLHLWIATNGVEPMGYCILSIAADEGEIQTLAVARRFRRSGVATALLHHVLQAPGMSEFFLDVRADNHAAMALYGQVGFAEIDRRNRYYDDGEDAILMGITVGAEGADR